MPGLNLILLAWGIEALFSWPALLQRHISHPVSWIGAMISWLEALLNRHGLSAMQRRINGAVCVLLVLAVTLMFSGMISWLLPDSLPGVLIEAALASSLLASRSLHEHVRCVASALAREPIEQARQCVARIVGRDTRGLDEPGIARAAIESLAENASDGVVAPVFWGLVAGLPGMALYKAINTLDSMIAHRNERFGEFGRVAAHLDDLANLLPARLTGLLIVLVSARFGAWQTLRRDASRHRSPNAGWPESAMAGALGLRLSGPRHYGPNITDEPWLNAAGEDADASDILRALTLYRRMLWLLVTLLILFWFCGVVL